MKIKNCSIPFISILIAVTVFLPLCLCLLSACAHVDDSTAPVPSPGSPTETGSSLSQDPLWTDPDSMTAMILSDLHYTDKKDLDHSLVPGMALSDEITDIVIGELINRNPDVLILTGDNTNSGDPGEVYGLTAKLQRLRDKGIGIIVTTGNHDFDRMDAADYEKAYWGLLSPVDRDPASLSYTSIVKNVVFLAMDDNAVHPGGDGEFSPETMQWLEQMLEKYRGSTIIFLSHHNVLYGAGENRYSSNLINNPGLPALLRENGVELIMTGHMHFPYILEKDGLWEILSGMPFSGQHLLGSLVIGQSKSSSQDQTDNPVRAVYYAEPIDFASYDKTTAEKLEKLDRESSDAMTGTLSELLAREGLWGSKKRKVMNLISLYFQYYNSGSLAEAAQELKNDPSYETMIQALWDYNYGPWIKKMVETTTHNSRELEITFSP